jgi:invasion protein IalB
MTELDTGAWLQSVDVKPSSPLPDCDANPAPNGSLAAPPVSQITLASLDAALAQQANAVPPSPGQPPGSWTVTCGPASASLAVGTDILCGQFNPSIGSSEEVVQITGNSPSSFTVLVGPGSSIPCAGLNAAEQAAFTADGQSCS